jgi:hypothetical protein
MDVLDTGGTNRWPREAVMLGDIRPQTRIYHCKLRLGCPDAIFRAGLFEAKPHPGNHPNNDNDHGELEQRKRPA